MLGAIYGDIVGSVYEFNNIKTKEFALFCKGSDFTDDTVMTVAVANALMKFDDWKENVPIFVSTENELVFPPKNDRSYN